MVILITPAETNGGILQFSYTMLRTIKRLNNDVKMLVPDNNKYEPEDDLKQNIIYYRKVKTVRANNPIIKEIINSIIDYGPKYVICMEDSLLMQQLSWHLAKRKINVSIVVHDVIAHPYYSMTWRERSVEFLRRLYMRRTVRLVYSIIVLSNNSVKGFKNRYTNCTSRLLVLTLCAHVPQCPPMQLVEMEDSLKDYYLFFGRIDRYKGIDILVDEFSKFNTDNSHKLVIAGKGEIPQAILDVINTYKESIILINRFIQDGEMVYLYENSKCVVLPYIEASQSGVLPIAYYFSKPVIVSNLDGLTENVVSHITGEIFYEKTELRKCLKIVDNKKYTKEIEEYYTSKFNWSKNVAALLKELEN